VPADAAGTTLQGPAMGRAKRLESGIRTAFVATYPPRRCGVATFTHDLAAASGGGEIVVLSPPDHAAPYPPEVHHRIRRDEASDYPRVAAALGRCGIDVVSIQHEFGIWGGDDGEWVLDFVAGLNIPAVVTLHTVIRHPTLRQRRIVVELVNGTAATVVMSRAAAGLLTQVYGLDPQRVEVIPHGVPNLPLVDPETMKPGLDLAGRTVILSFGLLGRGKGYEAVVEAMPAVAAAVPSARYVVLGATHPELLRLEGERYRRTLVERVAELRLSDHVQFVDRFVGRVELGRWLEAADIFVTAYPNLDQIVSGTLAYALGAGKAIVSTPYAYASEVLTDGRGVLVTPGSPAALASAFIDLLADPERRAAIGRRAYDRGRGMIWSSVGATYRQLFGRIAARPMPRLERASVLTPTHA
jgi:glycosyltransferase involved in cell wall biosynthesis